MDWLDRLARTLDVDAPTAEETGRLLEVARDVAHGVERRITPVSTFVLGMSVERRIADGAPRDVALASAIEELRATLPPGPEGEPSVEGG